MKTRFEVFLDGKSEWRWHARRGSKIVADSAEGYKRKSSLLKSLKGLIHSVGSVADWEIKEV